ncbi:unnamed protein product [Adineta ricciae]|uniref:Amino acid transporter n=1 Tax=Adineta ricciae TaxID=249248 RepID=A0A814GXZ4_ADIRI|nr:unnamed protein product [Adineta ricciae]CAF1221316.1 unnamed protein product [Adineta ricciae]
MTGNGHINHDQQEDSDVRLLREMGYTQELYRGFSPLMSFAFCFTAVNVLASISLGFTFTLNTGGSGVAIWSWIVGSLFTILIGLSLAEICSVYPSAGSVYHWAGQLISARRAPVASFICGWFNFSGNVAADAAFSSGFATMINSAIMLNGQPSLSIGIQVAIGVGITFVWAAQNALRIDRQGWLNNLAAFFQIASSIAIVIVLLTLAPQRATAHDVFTSTYNATNFPFAYVCCISILSTLFSFSGYEAGAHLAEETRGAGRAAPKGIVGTCVCSAVVGVIYLLALLFAIPNVEAFIESYSDNNETMSLVVSTYQLAAPGRGAMALTILLILNLYFAGMSSITVTSRIGFAMARDGVFPFSSYLRWIYQRTQTPLANIVFVFVIDSLLLLLQLASTTAFTDIIAIATLGFQISYLIPIFLRCTAARKAFPLGEFNLGRFGLPIGIISSIWLMITSIFMFFPTTYPVTADNMNYTVVIVAGIFVLAASYWLISARHWFVGPKRTDLLTEKTLPVDETNVEYSPGVITTRF